MTKKIQFNSIEIGLSINHPKPASKLLPSWLRKLPLVASGVNTVKACMPFLDSMMSGYMIVLAADVYYDSNGFQNIAKVPQVMSHLDDQIDSTKIPLEYSKTPHKWSNNFIIKTPKGYSTLFVHPLNRFDLPFQTLSGVVETDRFELQVNFPFLIKSNFNGVIPAGTPIAQAIPFKRTKWKSHVEDKKPVKLPAYRFIMHNPPFKFYKKNFWVKKTYQ